MHHAGSNSSGLTLNNDTTKKSKTKLREQTSVATVEEMKTTQEQIDFNSMTVKDLKTYAEENNIELPSNLRKAEIIEVLEKSKEKKPRRKLPEIPKSD